MLSIKLFEKYLRTTHWYKPGLKLLVACSGGLDSSVLLHLLQGLTDLKIDVIHFNHQLRGGESQADQEFAEQLGQRYGCQVHIVTEDIQTFAKKHQLSLEEAGSLRRKRAFLQKMSELSYDLVATGQHFDDQIETILINLYLGTGIQGLAGIAELQDQFVRPLLNFSQFEIIEYATQQKLSYRVDQTNTDTRFLRNNIRAKLLPYLNPDNDPRFKALFQGVSQMGKRLNEKLKGSIDVVDNNDIRATKEQKISLGMGKLPDYFSPIQKMIFDRAFQTISLMPQGLSSNHFKALKSLYPQSAIGRYIQLPASVTVFRDRHQITFILGSAFEWESVPLSQLKKMTFPFFQFELSTLPIADHIENPNYFWYEHQLDQYQLRMAVQGDKMETDGNGRRTAISQILQEAHVAPHLKNYYPVLIYQKEIVWVPGIRTAPAGMISHSSIKENKVKHCIRVQFQEGTFE